MIKLLATLLSVILLVAGISLFKEKPPEIFFGTIQSFGQTTDNASVQTNSTDRKYVNPATPSASGTVVSGVARIWNTGTVNSNSRLVIYTNASGNCDTAETLLAQSEQVTLSTGGTDSAVSYTFSGANQISVTSGTSYCIGVHFSDPGTGNVNISRSNTIAPVRSDGDVYSDGPTATCSCTTSSNGPLDLYIEFDDAVGVAASGEFGQIIIFE